MYELFYIEQICKFSLELKRKLCSFLSRKMEFKIIKMAMTFYKDNFLNSI